ncbi:hypothetical protein Tco_0464603 [Tanacetum coccineum]
MKSIKEGPFQMGTVSDVITGGTEGAVQQGPVRARVLNDLSAEEKERYKADIRATNILLQGIPKDIYSLINHYTDAKDIWENVKMILEGSELTKDDRESQIMMERFGQPNTDPLALVSDASTQQYPTQSSKSPNSTEPCPSDNFPNERRTNQLWFKTVKVGFKISSGKDITMSTNQGRPIQRNNRERKWCGGKLKSSEQRRLIKSCPGNGAVLDEDSRCFLAGNRFTNYDEDVDDSTENDLALKCGITF